MVTHIQIEIPFEKNTRKTSDSVVVLEVNCHLKRHLNFQKVLEPQLLRFVRELQVFFIKIIYNWTTTDFSIRPESAELPELLEFDGELLEVGRIALVGIPLVHLLVQGHYNCKIKQINKIDLPENEISKC